MKYTRYSRDTYIHTVYLPQMYAVVAKKVNDTRTLTLRARARAYGSYARGNTTGGNSRGVPD